MSIGVSNITKNEDREDRRRRLNIFDAIRSVELKNGFVKEIIVGFLSSAPPDYSYRSDQELARLLTWLMEVCSKVEAAETYALKAITKIIKCYSEYRMFILIELFKPRSFIYSRSEGENITLRGEYFVQSILDCIDAIVSDVDALMLEDEMMSGKAVLRLLVRMHYWDKFNISQFSSIVLHSLVLLKKLILLCKEDIPQYIGEVLGICMTYMFLGNSVKEGKCSLPQKVDPSTLYSNLKDGLEPVQEKTCGKCLKQKKNRLAYSTLFTSHVAETCHKNLMAEEYIELCSDINSNIQQNCKKEEVNIKIRMASIDLLGDTVRCVQQHLLYSYWQSLFPCDIEENKYERSDILLVSESDDNSKCRFAALQVCTYLLLNSKSLFISAEYRYRSGAFIPLSQKFGLTIFAASQSLMITIARETSIHVLIQALKCTSALVQVTDLTKFECRMIHNIIHMIKKLVSHKDWTVQVSALNVLECVFAEWKMSATLETYALPKDILSSEGFFSNNSMNEEILSSWLLSEILNNLGYLHGERRSRNVQKPNPLRIKSFQLLSVLAVHFEILKNHLNYVVAALEEGLRDNQFDIRLCASKCLDAVACQMCAILESDKTIIDTCTSFWVRIVPSIIQNIQLENELCAVKTAVVAAISNIGAIVFDNLPQSIRISLLTFLTGFCSETTADVIIRANIVRALSIFVTFSSIRNNLVFIENTSDLLLRLSGVRNISVRIKVIWSMGNISDALVENSLESFNERISDEILWSLIKQAIEACNDKDKVRCNAVRAIGNLMRLLSEKHFIKTSDRILIKLAISKLVDGIRSSGTSKVKWNSCYAVGNVIQNETIFICMEMYKDISWKRTLYSSLCQAICSNSNYKVKINAATATLHISKRTYIAEYCGIIWKTIVRAMEQSHNLVNFYEFNHRDVLQEQLCLLLGHIINLATLDDYILLSRILLERTDIVRSTWIRVTQRMIPEKSASLLACSSHLYDALKSKTLNLEQTNSIKLILYAIPFNY